MQSFRGRYWSQLILEDQEINLIKCTLVKHTHKFKQKKHKFSNCETPSNASCSQSSQHQFIERSNIRTSNRLCAKESIDHFTSLSFWCSPVRLIGTSIMCAYRMRKLMFLNDVEKKTKSDSQDLL